MIESYTLNALDSDKFLIEIQGVVSDYLHQVKHIGITQQGNITYLYSTGEKTAGTELKTFSSYIVALHYALNVLEAQE